MDFSTTKFMSKVESFGGIARKNRFTILITPPTTLNSRVTGQQISFLAKAVSFPDRSLGSTTYRSGGRHSLEVPYETAFSQIGVTMVNTNDHAPRKFWTAWFEHIQSAAAPANKNYYMKYYKDFVGSIKITNYADYVVDAYESTGEGIYEVTLHNAWPKIMSGIDLGWENSELSDFTIDIVFSHWTEEGATSGGTYTDARIADFQATGDTSRGF